ncbi:hypothetical protein BN946_scf184999.g30 [Trametes cinnabarina]|uniref:Uncharacterized protein n=1 Tax=Pycnoporus cinnabarinus TaxID=5643 RepID=A0A060S7R0_PYCCI|nr:hypothetical protein BN946_scf184999.g30 [Trametes cinnabarina]
MPASPQQGHASNLRSGNPNAAMHRAGQGGGSARVMILGMAAVTLGFYGFWRLQFTKQDRSHTSSNPGEMPTWQFRHAQQAPEFNERMSSPGGTGTNLRPRGYSANEPAGAQYVHASPVRTEAGGGGAASSDIVGVGSRDGSRRGLESGGASERGGESHAPAKEEDSKDGTVSAQNGGPEKSRDRGVVASIMTALNGTQNEDGHVGQPAPVKRLNDRGGIYTKNSDYKDGFRRD